MTHFEPIMTQDELDEIISRRVARERKRQGDGTDWVAEARKWEARAKRSSEEADQWRRRAKYNQAALQQTEKLYERFLNRFGEFLDKEFDDE